MGMLIIDKSFLSISLLGQREVRSSCQARFVVWRICYCFIESSAHCRNVFFILAQAYLGSDGELSCG